MTETGNGVAANLARAAVGRTFLVTGGAGFIGSRIVGRLLRFGARVLVLDDLSTGRTENLPLGEPGLSLERGSVTDAEIVRAVVEPADFIVHAAARNIIVSTRDPREDYETNIGGTLNLLLAAQASDIRRVVYASSASVYGNPRHLPIGEDDPVNLLTPYSVSKYAGESYCRSFHESYGLSTSAVRYSNVYGPGQLPTNPYCGVVTRFLDSAMSGRALTIHGDGEQTRDFTYVDDAVEATLLAMFAPRAEGQVYNVATGRETSVNELARAIAGVTEGEVTHRHLDRRDIDNIRRRALNIEKIRRELRWAPTVRLEQGLERTLQSLRSEGDAGADRSPQRG